MNTAPRVETKTQDAKPETTTTQPYRVKVKSKVKAGACLQGH